MRIKIAGYVRWIPGILVALAGVCIARLISPALPSEYQTIAFALGTGVAIAGIFMTAAASGKSKKKPSHQNKP